MLDMLALDKKAGELRSIINVIDRRLERGASRENITAWLLYLKKDVWRNSPSMCRFLGRLIKLYTPPE
jgi:hypothetical protein